MTQLALPEEGEVHIWKFELDVESPMLANFSALLSPDEIRRAREYKIGSIQKRFIVGRATLRSILGSYLGLEPSKLEITYTENGKPELPDSALRFNLSNSDALAILAVSQDAVGVDLERIRVIDSADAIARSHLTSLEREGYFMLPSEQRSEALLCILSRKEAIVKAWGIGLSVPLEEIEVGLGKPSAEVLYKFERPLKLYDLKFESGYIGALATSERVRVMIRNWGHQSSF